MRDSEKLTLGGLELNPDFPFMNGAGAINGAGEENLRRDFESFIRAPGAIALVGSVTVNPKLGNEDEYGGPVYLHFKETGFTYNSMGLPNLGLDKILKILPEFRSLAEDNQKELAVSLAPVTKDPAKEWIVMADKVLSSGVKIIEFNAGCPNVYDEKGNPKAVLSHDPDMMGEVLERVKDVVGDDYVVGVKISPAPVDSFGEDYQVTEGQSKLILAQADILNDLSFRNFYVAYFNTFGGRIPTDDKGAETPLSVPGGAGGVSGTAVANVARRQTLEFLKYISPQTDVVSAGGIANGLELAQRLLMDDRIKLGSAVTPLWEAKSLGDGAVMLAEQYAETL